MLITHGASGLEVDHLPFLFDPAAGHGGVLLAHAARANPLWQACAADSPVMVVFRGVDGYISPNWYPSKHETHRQVPTWNYEAVHVRGTLTVRDDARFLRGVVGRLTRRHEAQETHPWKMSDAPPDYLDDMLGRIVGIEIAVTSIVGMRKLGQNKQARDRLGAAQGLQDHGNLALAQCMRDPESGPA